MEAIAKNLSLYLSLAAEIIAAVVIGVAIVRFIYGYGLYFFQHHAKSHVMLRVQFGSALTLALELMLAADILVTAVAPSWDDIGKLAAIAAIRTALNYFLEKELATIEQREAAAKSKY